MVSSISSAPAAQPVAQSTSFSTQKTTQLKSQPAASSGDTVQLSSAAKAALAAIQEAQETRSQTAREASNGDAQAKRLLAREAAPKAPTK
jgi:hypothetical protein